MTLNSMEAKSCCGSIGHRHKKGCTNEPKEQTMQEESMPEVQLVENEEKKRIEELEKQNQEMRKSIEMLLAVADKGRVFNYENKGQQKKTSKIKLSVFNEKVIVGWRTVKDEHIRDPRTGVT